LNEEDSEVLADFGKRVIHLEFSVSTQNVFAVLDEAPGRSLYLFELEKKTRKLIVESP